MHCPYCNTPNSRVLDSRTDGDRTRRRRICQNPDCGARFTTFESVHKQYPRIQKKSGSLEQFKLDKIRHGIELAMEKNAQVSTQQIENIIQDIDMKVAGMNNKILASDALGDIVLEHLAKTNAVAYIRFASVYQRFKTAEDFQKILDNLHK